MLDDFINGSVADWAVDAASVAKGAEHRVDVFRFAQSLYRSNFANL
jgi:hypothetical protein